MKGWWRPEARLRASISFKFLVMEDEQYLSDTALSSSWTSSQASPGTPTGSSHAHLNQTVKCHSLPLPDSLLSAKAKPSNPLIFFLYIYFKGTCTPLLWINHLYGQVKKGSFQLLSPASSSEWYLHYLCSLVVWGLLTRQSLWGPVLCQRKVCSHAVFFS